jgi:hypothetical protein
MGKTVALNQTDVSVTLRILADSTGVPNTGVNNSTTGLDIYYIREGAAAVSGGVSTGDLSSATAPHSDWDFIHLSDGWYRVDYPDAAFAEGVGTVTLGITADSFTGIGEHVKIEPLYKFQGNPASVTSTTRTKFESGTTPLKGDVIMVVDGTGDPGNQVLVTSVSAEEAVHAPFSTGISAANTTVLLIAGDAVTADGGINNDAANSTLATPTEVNAQCSAAIETAALATQAKLLDYVQLMTRSDTAIETDNASALAEINTNEGSGAGDFDPSNDSLERLGTGVNIAEINDTTVIGVGTSASLWRA